LRLNLTASTALAHHTHEEVPEAIVQPLDVWQHAHGLIVILTGACVHPARGGIGYCTRCRGQRMTKLSIRRNWKMYCDIMFRDNTTASSKGGRAFSRAFAQGAFYAGASSTLQVLAHIALARRHR
jgi:hypothetical protein